LMGLSAFDYYGLVVTGPEPVRVSPARIRVVLRAGPEESTAGPGFQVCDWGAGRD